MLKKKDINKKHKIIKIDTSTHKLLRIYAAENELGLGEAVRELLEKARKNRGESIMKSQATDDKDLG